MSESIELPELIELSEAEVADLRDNYYLAEIWADEHSRAIRVQENDPLFKSDISDERYDAQYAMNRQLERALLKLRLAGKSLVSSDESVGQEKSL